MNHRHEDFQSTALPLSYPGTGKAFRLGSGGSRTSKRPCPDPNSLYFNDVSLYQSDRWKYPIPHGPQPVCDSSHSANAPSPHQHTVLSKTVCISIQAFCRKSDRPSVNLPQDTPVSGVSRASFAIRITPNWTIRQERFQPDQLEMRPST